MVREAYALLRQSIIHVEQDDIDFEDDIDEALPIPAEEIPDSFGDQDMDLADIAAAEEAEATYNASSLLQGASSSGIEQGSRPVSSDQTAEVPSVMSNKKKLKISCAHRSFSYGRGR
jgi:DNA replication licensing factor MCM6